MAVKPAVTLRSHVIGPEKGEEMRPTAGIDGSATLKSDNHPYRGRWARVGWEKLK